jgi:hypothetical protein
MSELFTESKKYLLIPLIRNPYYRIGSEKWQDYYRQIQKTANIARGLKNKGAEAMIVLLSNFQPKGKPSEIQIYQSVFEKLAPELNIVAYRETNSTLEQVERSFELKKEMGAELIFISTWMHYLRVRYMARGKPAQHYAVFGMPQPAFAIIDPICIVFGIILEPIADFFGIGKFFREFIIREREKGKIL